jgi:hypothetical protein
MPRSEARVFTSIWKDPHFTGIDPGAQWMYLFLLSQDDLAYSGVMPLRERRWAAKASGLTVADIESALKVLEGSPRRFIITDESTGELFVRSLLRRDGIWKQPNLLKQARESAEQIESPRIRAALLAELRRLPLDETPSEQVKTLVAEFIQDLEQGSPYPTAYPSDDPDPNPLGNPSDDPTDKDYARAQGLGESNGSSGGDSPIPPIPLIPGAPSLPRPDRKLGTRLPDDFPVTADMREWFASNCPHVDGRREHAKFGDYWRSKPGKEGRKLDWVMTWRNWMRTAEERSAPRVRGTPSAPAPTDVSPRDEHRLRR